RFEKFDHNARRIHAARGVDARAEAKAYVVDAHSLPRTTACNLHQRAQAEISHIRQILQTERDDGAILSDERRDIGDRPDRDQLEEPLNRSVARPTVSA